ncbi:MAG: Ribosomal RNA small subunit methyltransferase H [candidate division TM6 bacterium GW2011_GWF2_30_66]|nr:MAG: Ribosomal RNA small subunit methyltransferase H [candidate division TM6 bacterium GW2011_GWF2_30_66]
MEESKFYHKPVLVSEVLQYLDPKPGGVYLDVTFGSGGHTRAILEKEPTCKVIAMDWDSVVLDKYGPPLQELFTDRLRLVWGNFSLLYKLIKSEKIPMVDGILADFGTSQIQITERAGFSMFRDTPLDMRMSPSHQKITAEIVLRDSSEKKLVEIFSSLGEERYSRKIAYAIVQARSARRIRTTKDLADIIEKVVPKSKTEKIHPATRVFQALRIFVNKELENIESFFPVALKLIKPSGKLVCISFHSLEDRIVKDFFKDKATERVVKILTPKVVTATEEELFANRASRSAKLRAVEILEV